MSEKTYDLLKFLGQIVGYVAIFASALSEIWGFRFGAEIAASIAAAGVLVNSIVRSSAEVFWQDHTIKPNAEELEEDDDENAY